MKQAIACAVALALAGCAVGPDFKRPNPPEASEYLPAPIPGRDAAGRDAQHAMPTTEAPANWWTAFGSDDLNALVARALKANPTVSEAQATLRVARETLAAERSAYWPSISAGGDASRHRDAIDVLAPTLTSGNALFNLYTAQVNVGYTLDVFGLNRRTVESLAASAEVSRWQLDAAYLTVAGNVVTAAIQLAGVNEQIATSVESLTKVREVLGILKRQNELGAVGGLDVATQETLLAQTEAQLPPFERNRESLRHLLAVLAGRLPAEADATALDLRALKLPLDIPVGVPSTLVSRRPDVRSAEAAVHAATANVGVARANLLPRLTLGAALGSSALTTADLFRSYTKFWTAGASLSQTLFQGGALIHRSRAAEAALDAAGARYRAAVLTAFQNVADALRALEADEATLSAAERAGAASARSLAIVRRQLELGGVSHLALLNAQAADAQARGALAAARTARFVDAASLYQAVAGPVDGQTAAAVDTGK